MQNVQNLLDRVKEIDLYQLLGVETYADEQTIRKAYRKKALEYHPDKNPDKATATKLFLQLSDALAVLTSEYARKVYDNAQVVRKAEEIARKCQIENLICQICNSYARPRKGLWYKCLNRHQICQDCCAKRPLNLCSCGKTISIEHCKDTEKWLNAKGVKFKCKNKKIGCQEVFEENTLEDHEFECPCRLVPCLRMALYQAGCEAKVQFQNAITHYEDHKGCTYEELGDYQMNTKTIFGCNLSDFTKPTFWRPMKVKLFNETFLFAAKIEDSITYMWVYILASPEKAKKYKYLLKLFSSRTTTLATYTFEGKVAAIDETFGDLCEAGKCFGMPFKLFESQLDKDRCFTYSMISQCFTY